MKRPPYGKVVEATPVGYWDRGTRVLIFAGPQAWAYAKPWLDDVEWFEVMQARHRYTLVCPPDLLQQADVMRWPVAGRAVVIVACGAGDYNTLIAALQRDGCTGGEVIDSASLDGPLGWAHALRLLQPWAFADWDADVRRAHEVARQASRQVAVDALAELCAVDAWLFGEAQQCPPGTYGADAVAALRERASPAGAA